MPESPELLMLELLRLLPFRCWICNEPATRAMYQEDMPNGEVGTFCDSHGPGDSERYRNLKNVVFEELSQASVVRRCLQVRVMPDHELISECDFHGAVEGFCQVINDRLNRNPKKDSTWVRVRPPSNEELEASRSGLPQLLPFIRPGSIARVVFSDPSHGKITLDIGGETAVYDLETFNRSFIQAVEGHQWHLNLDE